MKQERLNNEFKQIANKYRKLKKPMALKEACMQEINFYEDLIYLVLKNGYIPDSVFMSIDVLTNDQSSLCKFFNSIKFPIHCNVCLLNCWAKRSIYRQIVNSRDSNTFVKNSYKMIKAIRENYYLLTKEVV